METLPGQRAKRARSSGCGGRGQAAGAAPGEEHLGGGGGAAKSASPLSFSFFRRQARRRLWPPWPRKLEDSDLSRVIFPAVSLKRLIELTVLKGLSLSSLNILCWTRCMLTLGKELVHVDAQAVGMSIISIKNLRHTLNSTVSLQTMMAVSL